MPVPIVVEWRRPGFYKRTYLVRRHQLAELLASLGMVAGRDFPEYVPPAQDRAQRRATGAGAEEEPAELQARAPLLDDGAECAGEEEEQPEGHGGQEPEGHGGQEPEGQARSWMMAPNAHGVKEAQPEGHGGQEPALKLRRI